MKLPTKKTVKQHELTKMNSMIYGVPKIGKSTFASTINGGEGVLFCSTEKGYNHLEVYNVDITSWNDFRELGRTLSKDNGGYKILVIDTVDLLVKQCERYVCQKHGVEHPSDLSFGKGFTLIKDEFITVATAINQMGFSLCFISHAKEREQKTKTQTWTYMDTSLSATWSTLVCGMCDFIFYIHMDSEGNRKIRTKGHKYINSGDRTGKLPEVMPLDFGEIQKCLQKS
jgi:hypothetical protein